MIEKTQQLGTKELLRLLGFHARRLARRSLRRSLPTYRDVADRQWSLAPAESVSVPPAIFLDGQLDRIIDDPRFRTTDHIVRDHVERIRRNREDHQATVAYQLKDAWILDGSVWKGTARVPMVSRQRMPADRACLEELTSGALACTLYGNSYWGHWLTDDVLLHQAAVTLAPPFRISRPPYPHEEGYSRAFGLSVRSLGAARIGELLMIDDRGKNSFRTRRYRNSRAALEALAPSPTASRVFLRRGKLGAPNRNLANEAEAEAFLEKQGFTSLTPETKSAEEVIRTLRGARIIVAVEGSACAHSLHTLAAGGTLMVLQPPYRFVTNHKVELDCIGANYAFVVGRPEADGFVIPLDDLGRTLDLVERRGQPG